MYKKFAAIVVGVLLFSSCQKNQQSSGVGCGTGQACTAIFTTVTVQFIDNQGKPQALSSIEVFDLTTNKQMYPGLPNANLIVGSYVIANDSELKDLSTDGDSIRVTATSQATGETKTTIYKIAGGCNCHVTKISGPDTIQFN
jgi:hypothetical protein